MKTFEFAVSLPLHSKDTWDRSGLGTLATHQTEEKLCLQTRERNWEIGRFKSA